MSGPMHLAATASALKVDHFRHALEHDPGLGEGVSHPRPDRAFRTLGHSQGRYASLDPPSHRRARCRAHCRHRASPWQKSSSRRWPAAGTPPGHRSDAARSAALYRAARKLGQEFSTVDSSAMSEVASASCASRRRLTSLTRIREPAARCVATCIASPEPDVIVLQGKIARGCKRLPPPSTPRSSNRISLRRRVKVVSA